MPHTITIEDIPAHGAELSDEELAGVAGGMQPLSPFNGSSKCLDLDAGTTDRDPDF